MTTAYNIDCMEYMKSLPDNAFDLAVCDPPYGGGNTEQAYAGQAGTRFGGRFDKYKQDGGNVGGKVRKKIIAWDVAPEQEYFNELFRVSRNQIIWGGNYFNLPPTRCFLVWRKSNIPLEGFSMSPVEYAWTSFFRNASAFEHRSDGAGQGQEKERIHPAQKPVALYTWIYKNFAKAGDKILDTHLGSGSSRIAAYEMGLDFVGCEIDEDYFKAQEERFAAYAAQGNLFLGGK